MGQTELTVFLTLAATFGQTGFLVGYQVSSSEHPFCLIRNLQESQRLFQITDIGIDGTAVNTRSVLPPLLNMSFPERLSLYLMLVNLFVYWIP